MRIRMIMLALVLVVFTSGFTMPGCSQEQKQSAAELVERGAFLAFSVAFGKEIDRLVTALDKEGDAASPDLVEPIALRLIELRRLKESLASASLSDVKSLGNLAVALHDARRNLSCDVKLLPEGKLKKLLNDALERAGPWVEALARFLPSTTPAGDRLPANLYSDGCP